MNEPMLESAKALRALMERSRNIVFFGGAGVSTESGIPDFRSAHGMYTADKSYEDMLSIRFFLNRPDEFWDFYKHVMLYPNAKPNAAHYALARLEKQGKLKAVVTQNIDGLHQDAGSQRVLELHGTVRRNLCMSCRRVYPLDYVLAAEGTPRCECGGMLRPDVVLYGEPLDNDVMDAATRAVLRSDLLIVGGTSLTVYPAAGLLNYRDRAKLALLNRDETPFDSRADLIARESIATVLDQAIPAE